ncbi:PIG-L family deacetylase [Arthrobacter ginkgonis]|uniref:PIG-L family deacetylase n=1 Tax=Arthrobacter ginkgonis TaxID=1630594 RepID=A0ABP7C804_9MICC
MAGFDPDLHPVRRVLCFAAHPDDLDFGAAGTVAAWTAAGAEVHYCIMTDGDAGGFAKDNHAEMAALRHTEQRQAALTVGVEHVHFLGERDGYLEPSHEVMRRVVALIRQVRPDVVLAMHPERNWDRIQSSHPDHLACGEAVVRSVYPAVENPFAYPELEAEGLSAYKLPWLWLYAGPAERENHWVDVTETFDRKMEALRHHLTQHPDIAKMEAFVEDKARDRAAAGGLGEGRLAESFHVVAVNPPEAIAGF